MNVTSRSLSVFLLLVNLSNVPIAEAHRRLLAFAAPVKRNTQLRQSSVVISNPDVFDSGGAKTSSDEPLLPDMLPAESVVTSDNIQVDLWKLALAGGIATVLGDALVHPVDCIKTLQQSDMGIDLSLSQAAQYLWNDGGVAGFYRGLGTYVVSDGVGGVLKFSTYEACKGWAERNVKSQLGAALFVCAAIAFLASSVVLVPGEFLKQQLQVANFDTLDQALTVTLQQNGPLGFYAGYDGVLVRDIPYTMLELGLYDNFKRFLTTKSLPWQSDTNSKFSQVGTEVLAAACAGGITAYLTAPLDTIKTKLMVDAAEHSDGFLECMMSTVNQYGVESLFAGGLARVAWILPFTAFYLPIYELLKRKLIVGEQEQQQQQV